jgi:hypothetical protein
LLPLELVRAAPEGADVLPGEAFEPLVFARGAGVDEPPPLDWLTAGIALVRLRGAAEEVP